MGAGGCVCASPAAREPRLKLGPSALVCPISGRDTVMRQSCCWQRTHTWVLLVRRTHMGGGMGKSPDVLWDVRARGSSVRAVQEALPSSEPFPEPAGSLAALLATCPVQLEG